MSAFRNKQSIWTDILRAAGMTAVAIVLVLATRLASAHAVLMQSEPGINATVSGPDVAINLKFNSRVDGARSTLLLATTDGKTLPLKLEKQKSPEMLESSAHQLSPGRYVIRWQVLAIDGHITRGEIPFQVE